MASFHKYVVTLVLDCFVCKLIIVSVHGRTVNNFVSLKVNLNLFVLVANKSYILPELFGPDSLCTVTCNA